jgi:ribonuclease BN (tRNA processing enzyme)
VLEEQMAAPYFPVGLTEMRSQQNFYDLGEGRIQLGEVTLQTMWLNHPQGCMGFRLETKQGVMVYATDNEPGDALFDKNVRKLAAGADVLIYDAQYLPEEYEGKRGWGHSHWREAINVVTESGAKELVLFHHDPDHDDGCIDQVVKEARDYYPRLRAAAEGMQIEVSAQPSP